MQAWTHAFVQVMRKEHILEHDHGEYVRAERDVLTVRGGG